MVKQSGLLVLNLVIFVQLILQASLGIRLWSLDVKGIDPSHALITTHLINGSTLIVLVLVHLYMNRRWVRLQLVGPKSS
jgi:cytochrome b subunit of formate dehydrogenase